MLKSDMTLLSHPTQGASRVDKSVFSLRPKCHAPGENLVKGGMPVSSIRRSSISVPRRETETC